METHTVTTNWTSLVNNTDDFYCGKNTVGPIIWGIFSVPSICVGAPASVWLLWVLIQRQRRGLTNDIYMLNLTVMDLIYNIYILPFTFNYFTWRNELIFRASNVIFSLNCCGRPLLMTSMCADCYKAVVHPISYMKGKDKRCKVLVCALVWSLTIIYTIMVMVMIDLSSPFIVLPFAVSVPAIAVLDITILQTLRKPDPSGRSAIHPQKQRAIQTITNSLVMTLVCYLPLLLVYASTPLMSLTPKEMFCYILFPSSANAMVASTAMPLLCLGNMGKLTNRVCENSKLSQNEN